MKNQSEKIFRIFVDFDGTISIEDVGETLFLHFGDKTGINETILRWSKGLINSTECWEQICSSVNDLTVSRADEFLNDIKIDPYFRSFAEFCHSENFELTILSDGFDFYIERILKREGLSHIRFYSNSLSFNGGGRPVPSFPFTDEECSVCANCKRNHILSNSGEKDYTIYVGNGLSDRCPVQFCDFIFAKEALLKYCESKRISYFPFRDFQDVRDKIWILKNRKKIVKRHQAYLNRKAVYKQG